MARNASLAPPVPDPVRVMNATAAVFALVGSLALVAALAIWLARQPVFALRAIRIDGDVARNSLQTIRANAAPRLAGNFFSIDLAATKAAFEAVPWVRRAVVRRVFPNRLSVQLEEHRPAAFWGANGGDGGDRLVNTYGEVFQANPGDVDDDSLPFFEGPDGSAARMLALHGRLAPVFAPQRIEELVLSGRGSWRARLDDGATVELGRGSDEEIAWRTQRFVATVAQVAQRHGGAALLHADLRHREGYAVRLKGVTTQTEKRSRN
jgi:cell division protein FtsQ